MMKKKKDNLSQQKMENSFKKLEIATVMNPPFSLHFLDKLFKKFG